MPSYSFKLPGGKPVKEDDTPADTEVVTFVGADDNYQAVAAGGSGESNTTSNSGAGQGLALAKVGVDLPFKSITAGAGITLTPSATELQITAGAAGLPAADTTSIVEGSVDGTKELRFEVDGLTTATIRVWTVQDKDMTVAGTNDKLSAFAATTSAELAGVISDEVGTDKLVFNTSPTLVTPLLGTPTSGVLTNCTGLPTAGLVDDAVTLGKMAAGTAGNLITYDASGNPAAVATGTATHVLTSNGAGAAPTFQAAAGAGLPQMFMNTPYFAVGGFAVDEYFSFAMGGTNTTEEIVQSVLPSDATFNKLRVRIATNANATNCHMFIRDDGANAGTLDVTITGSTTGIFSDLVNDTGTIAAASLVNLFYDYTGSGSVVIRGTSWERSA